MQIRLRIITKVIHYLLGITLFEISYQANKILFLLIMHIEHLRLKGLWSFRRDWGFLNYDLVLFIHSNWNFYANV